MGRTGKWCAMEHWGVQPDIVCLAKGLASGMPLGAIVSHKNIMQKWVPGAHASTFGGNPVSCVAANATIDIIENETQTRLFHFSHMTYGEYRDDLVLEDMTHNLQTLVLALRYAAEKTE